MVDRTMPSRPPKSPKFNFGERSEGCLHGVHPDLVALARKALELSVVDFGVHCGCRTSAQQKALVAEGRSLVLDSRHMPMLVKAGGNGYGHAIDCHVFLRGRPDDAFDWPLLKKINDAFFAASKILNIPYKWGGDWRNFPDGPHFELPSEIYPKDKKVNKPEKKQTRRGRQKTRTITGDSF